MVNKFILQCLEMLESEEVMIIVKTLLVHSFRCFTEMMPYIYFITFL